MWAGDLTGAPYNIQSNNNSQIYSPVRVTQVEVTRYELTGLSRALYTLNLAQGCHVSVMSTGARQKQTQLQGYP